MCAGFQFATNNIEEGIGAAKMAQEAGVLPTSLLRHAIARCDNCACILPADSAQKIRCNPGVPLRAPYNVALY